MALDTDDNVLDDPPYALRLDAPQVRYPRDASTDHSHIWFYGRPDRYISAHDDAGAPYRVEFCVNCPAVRVTRVGVAGDPEPGRESLAADVKESET